MDTKTIWIVLHGHSHLAVDFINNFSELAESGDFILAPEALSRFYLKGGSGNIGATWMTKEDRDNEINDYVKYLDKLFDEEVGNKAGNFKINVLGFSQGAATLSRWMALGKAKADKIIFWCGDIAQDVDYSKSDNFRKTPIHFVFADNDPYFPPDFYKTQILILNKYDIKPQFHLFKGTHQINSKLVKEIII